MPKQSIKMNLDDDLWDLDTVSTVINAAKNEKNEKGVTMNMFALKIDQPHGSELQIFIEELAKNIATIPDGTRIQLMVQISEHWYPVDLEVRKNNVSVIMPEAGYSPSTATATIAIRKAFPEAEIYRFYPDQITMNGKERTLMIQSDGESCSRFALQQLFALQHLADIHQQLNAMQDNLVTAEVVPMAREPYKHYSLSFSNAPPEIATIFKSTQSPTAFNMLDPTVKEAIINSKGESLEQYNQRFTRLNPKADNRVQNMAIIAFKERYATKTKAYLDRISEKDLARSLERATRSGWNFLVQGAEYRAKYIQQQTQRADSQEMKAKLDRNMVRKKVNLLCHEERRALEQLDKEDPATKNLLDKLHAARIHFMGVHAGKKESLSTIYRASLLELNEVNREVINFLQQQKDQDFSAVIDTVTAHSQQLDAIIMPPERPNILRSAFSNLKDRFRSFIGDETKKSEIEKEATHKGLSS